MSPGRGGVFRGCHERMALVGGAAGYVGCVVRVSALGLTPGLRDMRQQCGQHEPPSATPPEAASVRALPTPMGRVCVCIAELYN